MWYLSQDHSAFKTDPTKLDEILCGLVEQVLKMADRYRMEFDLPCLVRAIGSEAEDPKMASLIGAATPAGAVHEVTGKVDPVLARILMRLLLPDLDGRPDLPLNYLQTVEFKDRDGRVIFHATEALEFVLFDLPPTDHEHLLAQLAAHGIPPEAVEKLRLVPASGS